MFFVEIPCNNQKDIPTRLEQAEVEAAEGQHIILDEVVG